MIHPIHAIPGVKADSSVDLLLKAQSGDKDALDRLLTRYVPRLRRGAGGRLPWDRRTMVNDGDLVQDAIIDALPHLHKLEIRTERALQVALQRAVKNRIIYLHKLARRRARRAEIPEHFAGAGISPQQAAIEAEVLERYERALASLKNEERHAIVLRVELGLDYEEMASHLGKPSSAAARIAVTRALGRLADKMGRHLPRGEAGNGI